MPKKSREKIKVSCPQEWYDHWTQLSRERSRAQGKPLRIDKVHTEDEIYEQYHPLERRQIVGRYHLGPWSRRQTQPDYMAEVERSLEMVFAKRRKKKKKG